MDDYFNTVSHALKRLEGAYAPNTIRSYYADTSKFVDWCQGRDLVPFPLKSENIVTYLEDGQCNTAYISKRRSLSALRRINSLLGHEDKTRGDDVYLAIRRLKRSQPRAQNQAIGINEELLLHMIAAQPTTLIGIRNRALISLGYDFLARRSELTGLMQGDLEFTNAGGLRGVIRRSKTDQFGEGRLVYGSKRSHDLLRKWLRRKPASSRMVFCAISHGTCLDRAICDRSVNEIIKKAVARVKIPGRPDDRAVSGHSLRVGAAQDLLTRGLDTAAIMRAGGWSNSQTLARYLKYAQHNIWD